MISASSSGYLLLYYRFTTCIVSGWAQREQIQTDGPQRAGKSRGSQRLPNRKKRRIFQKRRADWLSEREEIVFESKKISKYFVIFEIVLRFLAQIEK